MRWLAARDSRHHSPMDLSPRQARDRAVSLTAEMMGELVVFWGFKASMGRIWTLLYLSPRPLPADQIASQTELSAGAVSMALAELMRWGLVERASVQGARKRHYNAHTDVWAIVRHILRERELALVARAVQRFSEAVTLLEAAEAAEPHADNAFALHRLRGLLDLARIGYRLVERLADVGSFTLHPIRGALSRLSGPPPG